jgi:hypothetical protein
MVLNIMSIERFNFVIAYELYELDGELQPYPTQSNVQYGSQKMAEALLEDTKDKLPKYDWAIYKLVKA